MGTPLHTLKWPKGPSSLPPSDFEQNIFFGLLHICEVNVLQCVEDPWVVGTPLHTDRLLWPCVGGRGSSSRTNMPYTDPSADSQHSLNRPNWRNCCFLIVAQKREAETLWICSEFVFRSEICVNVQGRRKKCLYLKWQFHNFMETESIVAHCYHAQWILSDKLIHVWRSPISFSNSNMWCMCALATYHKTHFIFRFASVMLFQPWKHETTW